MPHRYSFFAAQNEKIVGQEQLVTFGQEPEAVSPRTSGDDVEMPLSVMEEAQGAKEEGMDGGETLSSLFVSGDRYFKQRLQASPPKSLVYSRVPPERSPLEDWQTESDSTLPALPNFPCRDIFNAHHKAPTSISPRAKPLSFLQPRTRELSNVSLGEVRKGFAFPHTRGPAVFGENKDLGGVLGRTKRILANHAETGDTGDSSFLANTDSLYPLDMELGGMDFDVDESDSAESAGEDGEEYDETKASIVNNSNSEAVTQGSDRHQHSAPVVAPLAPQDCVQALSRLGSDRIIRIAGITHKRVGGRGRLGNLVAFPPMPSTGSFGDGFEVMRKSPRGYSKAVSSENPSSPAKALSPLVTQRVRRSGPATLRTTSELHASGSPSLRSSLSISSAVPCRSPREQLPPSNYDLDCALIRKLNERTALAYHQKQASSFALHSNIMSAKQSSSNTLDFIRGSSVAPIGSIVTIFCDGKLLTKTTVLNDNGDWDAGCWSLVSDNSFFFVHSLVSQESGSAITATITAAGKTSKHSENMRVPLVAEAAALLNFLPRPPPTPRQTSSRGGALPKETQKRQGLPSHESSLQPWGVSASPFAPVQ